MKRLMFASIISLCLPDYITAQTKAGKGAIEKEAVWFSASANSKAVSLTVKEQFKKDITRRRSDNIIIIKHQPAAAINYSIKAAVVKLPAYTLISIHR
jgi:hypothetical protein